VPTSSESLHGGRTEEARSTDDEDAHARECSGWEARRGRDMLQAR
jgi:hypothetical protein